MVHTMGKLVVYTLFLAALGGYCRFCQAQSISRQDYGVITETFDLKTLLRENADPQVILQEQTKGSVKTVEINTGNSVQDGGIPAQQDIAYQQSLRKYQQDLNNYRQLLSQYSTSTEKYVQPVQQTYSQPYRYQLYQPQQYQTAQYQIQSYQSPSYQYQPYQYQYQPSGYQSYTGYQQGSSFVQPTYQRNFNPFDLSSGSSFGSLLGSAGSRLLGGLFG